MWTRAKETLNRSGPSSMPGPNSSVVDRKVEDVTVIDLKDPLVGQLPVHVFRDRLGELLNQGTSPETARFLCASPVCR
jgi:hypothetical protein